MTNVLILGAGGQIARHVVRLLDDHKAIRATLYVRAAGTLDGIDTSGMTVIEGDVANSGQLASAMKGQDIVYANLAGELDELAVKVIGAMNAAGVKRLIFVTSLGIYDEVPGAFGQWNKRTIGASLRPYRKVSAIVLVA